MAITINQNGLSAGLLDKSRSDGLATGALISITSSIPSTLTLVWRPDEETANLVTHDTQHWSITPTAGVYGSYMFYDSASDTKRIIAIRTPARNLRIPALNEVGHADASLINNTSPFIDASTFNEYSGSGPFILGNYGGWYSAIRELVLAVENIPTGPGSEVNASYLVLGATGSLTTERVFTPGTGINVVDGGANSTYTISTNNNIVATVSGTNFTGPVTASAGFRATQITGSLTQTVAGLSAFVGGTGISVVSNSSGQVVFNNTMVGDTTPSYLTLDFTSSLANERRLVTALGLTSSDAGAGADFTLSINNNVVATVSGTNFTGPVTASLALRAQNFTGSHTQTVNGLSAFVGGTGISVVSNSSGQVVISGPNPGYSISTVAITNTTASLWSVQRVSVTGSAVVISLPTVHSAADSIIVKLVSTASNLCTISGSSGATIDSFSSITLTTDYEWATLVSDGTNWMQLG